MVGPSMAVPLLHLLSMESFHVFVFYEQNLFYMKLLSLEYMHILKELLQ